MRARTAAALIALLAAAGAAGCGYDPATVDDGGAGKSAAAEATAANSAEDAAQRTAHLLADAEELRTAAEDALSSGARGREAGLFGRVKGMCHRQLGALHDYAGGGGAATVDASRVIGAADPAAAMAELLREELPRLRDAWAGLVDAPQPEIAQEARRTVSEIDDILGQFG